MYNYNPKHSDLRYINEAINYYLGGDYIYRVLIIPGGGFYITFAYEEYQDLFMSKHVSKYTCDTSSICKDGLTLCIYNDFLTRRIIEKSSEFYEKDKSVISHSSDFK